MATTEHEGVLKHVDESGNIKLLYPDVKTDDTLSVSGKPADAAKTGTHIKQINRDLGGFSFIANPLVIHKDGLPYKHTDGNYINPVTDDLLSSFGAVQYSNTAIEVQSMPGYDYAGGLINDSAVSAIIDDFNYVVVWDGIAYPCLPHSEKYAAGNTFETLIGNKSLVEVGTVDVFPETPIDGFDSGSFEAAGVVFPINEGETYTVEWDGTEYPCIATKLNMDGIDLLVLGNLGLGGFGEDTGEPFVMATTSVEGGMSMILSSDTESTSHTVHILQSVEGENTGEPFLIGMITVEGSSALIVYTPISDKTTHSMDIWILNNLTDTYSLNTVEGAFYRIAGADTVFPFNSGSTAALYAALQYSGLVTEDMSFDEMCAAVLEYFPGPIDLTTLAMADWGGSPNDYASSSFGINPFRMDVTATTSGKTGVGFVWTKETYDLTKYSTITLSGRLRSYSSDNSCQIRFVKTIDYDDANFGTSDLTSAIKKSSGSDVTFEDAVFDISELTGEYHIVFRVPAYGSTTGMLTLTKMLIERSVE